ncbi:FliA/WhiG family RNA polymerase sigma factor [soil metagenome]
MLDLQGAAERFVSSPTPANRRAVAIAAMPLVRSLVRRIQLPDNPLATFRDLEHAGMLGMLQALDQYDTHQGTAFASYSYGRIRGALIDFLRSIDTLSRERRRRVAEAVRTHDELAQELGGDPNDQQVAQRLDIPVEEYHRIKAEAQHRYSLSLHEGDAATAGTRAPTPLELIPHPDGQTDIEDFERRSLYDLVRIFIGRLPAREQQIVQSYYFDGMTLKEIAVGFDLTEARISQILSKTLKTLRTQLTVIRAAA